MKKNIGSIDKIIRIILALVLGVLYFSGIPSGTLGIVLLAISVIFLITSFIGSCPLYSIFGFSSCPLRPGSKQNESPTHSSKGLIFNIPFNEGG